MINPKQRYAELKNEIEFRKAELKKKGKYANFDYRILVLEAELKGISETMEYWFDKDIEENKK